MDQKTIASILGVAVVLGGAYYIYDNYQKKQVGQFRNASGLRMRQKNYVSDNIMAQQSKFNFASAYLKPQSSGFNFAGAYLMPQASQFR